MKIGSREIGSHAPPYVIAEIGVNHDGVVERALELTDAAAGAGADAVKLQLFRTDLLMSRAAKLAAYQAAAGETDPVVMLRRLELSVEEMGRVVERAHARGIHAIVTVFSVELVAEADRLAWDAYKSASPDIINRPLLEAMAATGRPLIVSTGASTMREVGRAVGWLAGIRSRLALLQCVSSYPVPAGEEGLGAIAALRERNADLPIGYSDHTTDVETGGIAAACGASILEKHLTYDKLAAGPDHAASATPEEFREYVRRCSGGLEDGAATYYSTPHSAAIMPAAAPVARCEKGVLPCERDVREVSRQSLTTRREMSAGHVLRRDDLTIKRPGTGIEPWRLGEMIGRRLARDLQGDVPLTDADLD
jgi:sialic acid synthase SpsE